MLYAYKKNITKMLRNTYSFIYFLIVFLVRIIMMMLNYMTLEYINTETLLVGEESNLTSSDCMLFNMDLQRSKTEPEICKAHTYVKN